MVKMIGPQLSFISAEPTWNLINNQVKQELYNTSFNLIIQDDEKIKQSGAQLVAKIFLADKLSENIW